jgi:hypothetical protein
MNSLWKPQGKNKIILDQAWAHIQSVPYQVGLRWLFYRLLQDGLYRKKEDYHHQMGPLFSAARKNFYGPWNPGTLADETRSLEIEGGLWDDAKDWYEYLEPIR